MRRSLFLLLTASVLGLCLVAGCGDDAEKYTANTTLTSSSLSSRDTLDTRATCPTGKSCLTPSNLEGRVYYGGLMVGGNGGTGSSLTTVAATDEVLLRPDQGKGGTLTFNVGQTTDLSGNYFCCNDDQYPSDEEAVVQRLEFGFDYLDTEFTVPATAGAAIASNTYTIRVIYATDATLTDVVNGSSVTAMRGDKLVKVPGSSTFNFCDGTDCSSTSRPASPLQDSNVANWVFPGDGNQNYASFAISLTQSFTFTKSEAKEGNWRFTVDFDMSNAAIFSHTSWAGVTTVQSLVNLFQLVGDPGDTNTSITVNVTKAKM